MPTVNRTTLLREPGKIIFAGSNLYSQGDIEVKPVVTNAEIATSVHGVVDRGRAINRMFTISGVLAGEWKDLAVLFGIMALPKGASVFGADDTPLIVHGQGGTKITLANAAITKPPAIIGKTGSTLFGAFEATAIIANNADPALAASYFTIANEAYPGDTGFDPATLLTLPLTAAWGAVAPWDSFLTRDGWQVTPNVTLSAEDADGVGTVDMKIADISVTAVGIPVGPTLTQQYTNMSFGQALGARRAVGDNLILSAAGVYIAMTDAVIIDGDTGFGDRPLIGQTTWAASRRWIEGVAQPLLSVGTAPPEA